MKNTFLLIFTLFVLVSCAEKEQPAKPQTKAAFTSGNIEIADAWVRPAAQGMMSSAYFTIQNGTAQNDTLLSVTGEFSDDVQIHETYQDDEGLMGMRPIALIPVPANSAFELKRGATHIMIIGSYQALTEGDSVKLELNFSSAGDTLITLPVKNSN